MRLQALVYNTNVALSGVICAKAEDQWVATTQPDEEVEVFICLDSQGVAANAPVDGMGGAQASDGALIELQAAIAL